MKKKTSSNGRSPAKPKAKKDANVYPKGWDAKRVQAVADHYENQSDDEAVAEDEAAYHQQGFTMMAVPVALVPKVQKLIAKRAG